MPEFNHGKVEGWADQDGESRLPSCDIVTDWADMVLVGGADGGLLAFFARVLILRAPEATGYGRK